MKQLSPFRIAAVFAGAFLGAGYVSGQELFQYFGSFGKAGIIGFFFSLLIMAFFGVVIMDYGRRTGVTRLDEAVVAADRPGLRKLAAYTQLIAYFGIVIIMFAGGGAMLAQLTGLPFWTGSLILAAMAVTVACFGLTGMVHTFSVLVPVAAVLSVGISIAAVRHAGPGSMTFPVIDLDNPLIPNVPVAIVNYATMNLFTSIGIFIPLGEKIRSAGKTTFGILLGNAVLTLIGFAILLAQAAVPESVSEELPMLAAAASLSAALSVVYGLLLYFSMFGTSIAALVVISEYFRGRFPRFEQHRVPAIIGIGTLGFVLSLFGFATLVGIIYPIYGYLCILLLVPILVNYVRLFRKKKASG